MSWISLLVFSVLSDWKRNNGRKKKNHSHLMVSFNCRSIQSADLRNHFPTIRSHWLFKQHNWATIEKSIHQFVNVWHFTASHVCAQFTSSRISISTWHILNILKMSSLITGCHRRCDGASEPTGGRELENLSKKRITLPLILALNCNPHCSEHDSAGRENPQPSLFSCTVCQTSPWVSARCTEIIYESWCRCHWSDRVNKKESI